MSNKIDFIKYTPFWKEMFLKEEKVLEKLLKNNCINIYHIGSTSIKKTIARPTLDLLVKVHTLDGITAFEKEFNNLGLFFKESPFEDSLMFVRYSKDQKQHLSNTYIFEKSNSKANDFLDFKDYLNAEKSISKKYTQIKEDFQNDLESYNLSKKIFIETILTNLK